MTHSYLIWLIYIWHDSFIGDMTQWHVMWLIRVCHGAQASGVRALSWPIRVWHDPFTRNLWCIHRQHSTHSLIHTHHDILIHMHRPATPRIMTDSPWTRFIYIQHGSFVCRTWFMWMTYNHIYMIQYHIYMFDTLHIYMIMCHICVKHIYMIMCHVYMRYDT